MKPIILVLMLSLVLSMGCAKKDWIQSTLLTVDVTGTWVGLLGKAPLGAEVRLELDQQGQKIHGTVRSLVSSNYGFVFPNGPLVGDVNGEVFSFQMTNGGVVGEMTVKGMRCKATPLGVAEPQCLSGASSDPPPRSQ